MNGLEDNLRSVQERMAAAAARSGRDPAEIRLVAVTKTQSPTIIRAAYELGLREFGENRVGRPRPRWQICRTTLPGT